MRKTRRIRSQSQARKPVNRTSQIEKWSNPGSTLVTALEQARRDARQAKRSHPADPSSAVYSPLLNQIIPPAGTTLPPIEKPQRDGRIIISVEDLEKLEDADKPATIRLGPIDFVCTLYLAVVLGSLWHSWWVPGVVLLVGLVLTGIVSLSTRLVHLVMGILVWFLMAGTWGYVGWLVSDSSLPLIVRCLCAFGGFILGIVIQFLIAGVVNTRLSKRMRNFKYCALTTFIDSLCISIVFGYLLRSWWVLGLGFLVGLILTSIIVLFARYQARDIVYFLGQVTVDLVWLLFALMWGYAGWFVFDAHIPSIIHFLCAIVGFALGFVGYPLAYAFLSPIDEEEKEERGEERRSVDQ